MRNEQSAFFALISLIVLSLPIAHAVPVSYSRQTGLPRASCHYAPPELTPFGRTFKLEGYTFTTKAQVTDDKKGHNAALQLLEAFPLSIVFDTSLTTTKVAAAGHAERQFPISSGRIALSRWRLDEPHRQLRAGHLRQSG